MSQINVLPKEVYQLIAAGEVVERPSSAVKEMIENCVDAGAKNIAIEIKNGGSSYIRVTDDGNGIEKSEVRKVFIPHATSKISKKDDLDSISTLGFRGEAMASIAAVARVELLTKAENESIGTRIVIQGGEEIDFDDAGCPKGTTIVVRDIFYNTPARMKFLKKDVTEGNSVAAIVDRMAISHPEISFRFIRDGKQVLITSGNGDLKSAIYSVFGKEISDALMPIDYSYNSMRVSGFISKPTSSRKSRAMQFFFINGRLVKSATAMAALEQAYKNSIMVGHFPMCVINIEMDASLVDVNVHPAKIEVRFANEKPVFDLVYYAVKTAIEKDRTVKDAKLGQSRFDLTAENTAQKTYSSKVDFFAKKENTPVQQVFRSSPKEYSGTLRVGSIDTDYIKNNRENITQKEITYPQKSGTSSVQTVDESDNDNIDFKLVGEVFKTYIIIEMTNDIYFIDKHAAHERMNYEKLKASATVESQVLLSPVAVNLSKEEYTEVIQNIDLINSCGFEVEAFGESSVLVRSIPSLLTGDSVKDVILEIAQKLLEHKTDITPDKIDWIYHSASCRGAVKAGDYTSRQEQQLFVQKLLSMPNIRNCPHGRPVFIKMSKYDIEKNFGRIV